MIDEFASGDTTFNVLGNNVYCFTAVAGCKHFKNSFSQNSCSHWQFEVTPINFFFRSDYNLLFCLQSEQPKKHMELDNSRHISTHLCSSFEVRYKSYSWPCVLSELSNLICPRVVFRLLFGIYCCLLATLLTVWQEHLVAHTFVYCLNAWMC